MSDEKKKKIKKGDKKAKSKHDAKASKKAPKKLLKDLNCTGCKKACPLKDPKCKKGRAQAEAALQDLLKK